MSFESLFIFVAVAVVANMEMQIHNVHWTVKGNLMIGSLGASVTLGVILFDLLSLIYFFISLILFFLFRCSWFDLTCLGLCVQFVKRPTTCSIAALALVISE